MSRTARRLSVEILKRLSVEKAILDRLLQSPEVQALEAHEARFTRKIVFGVLRQRMRLDFYIRTLSDRPLEKLDAVVLALLRCALYELEFLRTPRHATVHEAVELCRRLGKASAAGLVNAVLRRFLRTPPSLPQGNSSRNLSIRYSHPEWLVERYLKRYGVDRTVGLLSQNNRPPPQVVWVNPFKISRKEFCRTLSEAGIESLCLPGLESAVEVHFPSFVRHPLYKNGYCFFMGPASQAVAHLVPVSGGSIVGDLCAAPGGKSFILAARKDPSSRLICADSSFPRLQEMRLRAQLYGISGLQIVQGDIERGLWLKNSSFDSILLDVPCSGLGTIRSHPDIRWRLQENDLIRFQIRQRNLLENGFQALRRNGILTYATCSSEPEENEQVVEAYLAKEKSAQRFSADFRCFPDETGGEFFFAARIRRI